MEDFSKLFENELKLYSINDSIDIKENK